MLSIGAGMFIAVIIWSAWRRHRVTMSTSAFLPARTLLLVLLKRHNLLRMRRSQAVARLRQRCGHRSPIQCSVTMALVAASSVPDERAVAANIRVLIFRPPPVRRLSVR
jgi:hypothetical protein